MKTNVLIRLTDKNATMPEYKTAGASCADITSIEAFTLWPKQRKLVHTGLQVELLEGFECQVRPRSGLALKHGITVLNSPGTVDSDYRGEVGVILYNASDRPFEINIGDRIAQIFVGEATQHKFVEVNYVGDTDRGDGGFGSTGVKREVEVDDL